MKLLFEDYIKRECGLPPHDMEMLEKIEWLRDKYLDGDFLELAFRSACKILDFTNDSDSEKLIIPLKISIKIEYAESTEELRRETNDN